MDTTDTTDTTDEMGHTAWEHARSRGEDLARLFDLIDGSHEDEDEDEAREELGTYALDVLTYIIGEVLLSCGGPTERLTARLYSDSDGGSVERVSPVTYSHSWATGDGIVMLPDGHALALLFDHYHAL